MHLFLIRFYALWDCGIPCLKMDRGMWFIISKASASLYGTIL